MVGARFESGAIGDKINPHKRWHKHVETRYNLFSRAQNYLLFCYLFDTYPCPLLDVEHFHEFFQHGLTEWHSFNAKVT